MPGSTPVDESHPDQVRDYHEFTVAYTATQLQAKSLTPRWKDQETLWREALSSSPKLSPTPSPSNSTIGSEPDKTTSLSSFDANDEMGAERPAIGIVQKSSQNRVRGSIRVCKRQRHVQVVRGKNFDQTQKRIVKDSVSNSGEGPDRRKLRILRRVSYLDRPYRPSMAAGPALSERPVRTIERVYMQHWILLDSHLQSRLDRPSQSLPAPLPGRASVCPLVASAVKSF